MKLFPSLSSRPRSCILHNEGKLLTGTRERARPSHCGQRWLTVISQVGPAVDQGTHPPDGTRASQIHI